MPSLIIIIFVFSLCFSLPTVLTQTQSNNAICSSSPSSCDDADPFAPYVTFPFQLKNHQDPRCGYNTNFVLSCDTDNKTILNLPGFGGSDFIVEDIDYIDQVLWVIPKGCFSSRLLNSTYSHDFSPFTALDTMNFTLFNCSGEMVPAEELTPFEPYLHRSCLSGVNYTVWAVEEGRYNNGSWNRSRCVKVGTFAYPVGRSPEFDQVVHFGFRLKWDVPDCRACVARGGECDSEFECSFSDNPRPTTTRGLPRSAKYGIIIGVGIPGFLCLIGLGCLICGKINNYAQRRSHHHNADAAVFSIPIWLQLREVGGMGLDGPTLESYPKTKLGKSGRLPKSNDTTCSICLGDYQPEETLRTIPECGHYFHIDCIDEWLKMKGTCPLCRNSPEGSVFTATSLSPSSSSLLSVASV